MKEDNGPAQWGWFLLKSHCRLKNKTMAEWIERKRRLNYDDEKTADGF
jgi:hypothetical protein